MDKLSKMFKHSFFKDSLKILAIALFYFFAHQFAYFFPDEHRILMVIWPAGGIGLAALLLNQRKLWLPIIIVIFFAGNIANIFIGRPLFNSLGFMIANVLESLLGALVIIYFCGENIKFDNVKEILFLLFVVTIVNACTAFIGGAIAYIADISNFWGFWFTWWIAHGLGLLIVTPLIISWVRIKKFFGKIKLLRTIEMFVFLIIFFIASLIAFQDIILPFKFLIQPYFLLIILLVVAVLRYEMQYITLILTIVTVIAITSHIVKEGHLLLGGDNPFERVLIVQFYLGIFACLSFIITAITLEYKFVIMQLRQSESELKKAQHFAHVGNWTWDIKTDHLNCSDEMLNIFGINKDDFSGDMNYMINNVIYPEDREKVIDSMRSIICGEKPYSLEYRIILPDKTVRYILVETGEVLMDESGKPYQLSGIVRDITEQKESESALIESEFLYKSLFNNMLNGYAYCRMHFEDGKPVDWTYIMVNKAFENLTGLKDVIGKKATEVIPGIRETSPDLFEIYGNTALTGAPAVFETYVKSLDIWFYVSVYSPVKEYFVAIFDVITERKKYEKALRESEERYKELFDNIASGVAIYDVINNGEDFIFKDLNKAGERLDNDKKENVIGKSIFIARPGVEKFGLIDVLKRVWQTGVPEHFPARLYSDNRLTKWYENFVYKLPTGELVAVYDDVTERKLAENQIKSSLAEKDLLLKELYHRTKNNMHVIYSMIGLKLMSIEHKECRQAFKEIADKIHTMALVHQMLYKSQDLSKIDIKEYIITLVNYLTQSYREMHEKVKVNISVEQMSMSIDVAVPLGLIINELITNSFKYAFSDGRSGEINISFLIKDKKYVEFKFSDNGVGLSKDFDFRSQKTLGIKTIMLTAENQLQGKVEYETNNGVTFKLVFNKDIYKERV